MATIYISSALDLKKKPIYCQHTMCVHLVWLSQYSDFIFSAALTRDGFWDLLAEFFIIIFVFSLLICLEIEASLAETLLRHASHYTFPIFITPVEHLALKTNKLWNSQLDQNSAVLCQVAAVTSEAFMLTFNVQWLAVCEQSTQLYKTGNLRIKVHEVALA